MKHFWIVVEPEKYMDLKFFKKFIKFSTHFLDIFSLMQEVKFDWQIFLGLFDEPLKAELGEEPSHNLYAILHRGCVNFCISTHIVMLNFHGNISAIFQGRSVHLS